MTLDQILDHRGDTVDSAQLIIERSLFRFCLTHLRAHLFGASRAARREWSRGRAAHAMSGTERCPRASASWRQFAATQSTSGRFGAKQTLKEPHVQNANL
jgi:hypothetical protein